MATTEIKLPDIGEGVTEGELVKWLVKAGDAVKADQPLAEVMTDKATVEIPSSVSGTVTELKAKLGEVIPIGKTLLTIETSSAGKAATPASNSATPASTAAPASASAQASTAAKTPAPTNGATKAPAASAVAAAVTRPTAPSMHAGIGAQAMADVHPPAAGSDVLATPSTRRLAREMNVDINGLQGSGLAGRVTRDDVTKSGGTGATAAGSPAIARDIPRPNYQSPAGAVEERVPMIGVRKKVAEKMQLAKHVIPHFTLMDEANVTELVKWRASLKTQAAKYGVKVTYLPIVMKALIATMREFPMFNASIDDAAGEIVYKKYFNLGFAADTPDGLRVPVIKNADMKTILQTSKEISDLSEKARSNKISADDMKGATISITNIGSVGGLYATPIINHPEVAILGMYKIQERPIFEGDEIVRASIMNFSITADHRLIDGAVAANFLKAFIARMENPGALMLDMI